MDLAILKNVTSVGAQRQLSASQMNLSSSISRLSSGLRISSTQDNSAGLAIAARMRAQIDGSSQSLNNKATTEVQARDAELGQVSDALTRMLDVRTRTENGNLKAEDREALEKEFQANNNEINAIADTNNVLAYRPDYTAALGTRDGALQSTDDIRKAMDTVSTMRSDLGVRQNTLNESISNLQSSAASPSIRLARVEGTESVPESALETRARMMQQEGLAMLSQANATPQQVFALLR